MGGTLECVMRREVVADVRFENVPIGEVVFESVSEF